MPSLTIPDANLSYFETGKKTGIPVIILHGWLKKKEDYTELINLLGVKYRVLALDLPGFGESTLSKSWGLGNFTAAVSEFLRKKNIRKAILIGHSFGGSVALEMAVRYPEMVQKLVLLGSAGIRDKSLRVRLMRGLSAVVPRRIKDRLGTGFLGSTDYRKSLGVVRESMRRVVEEDIRNDLPGISVPVLLVWGEADHTTPMYQGELMASLIPGARLAVLPGADHGFPYRRAGETAGKILEFLAL